MKRGKIGSGKDLIYKMKIEYKDESLLKKVTNEKIFKRHFPYVHYKSYWKQIFFLSNVHNISEAMKNKGLFIKKLKNRNNKGSFRINYVCRVEFVYDQMLDFLQVEKITITKIHPHKYQ